ncbi:hypothetical protein MN116_005758 [Schistosoma mekongi]|uniref:Cadherin domain-containing protein n=1 Tax=Schistosoma mekongi TaxID=38744 RepID=A0AAE1ZAA2_SCHME|nr:hypothetical protein MN116_005758 [Schistosoma mekongi]
MNYTYFMYKLLLIYSIIYSPYWIIYIISFCTCFTYFITLPEIQVYENITIGTIILPDIRNLLGITKSSYIKLGPGSLTQYFRLDNHTGSLLSIASIDLETSSLCNTEKSCCPNHQYESISNELTNQYYANNPNYYSEYSNNLNHAIESKLLQEMHQCKLMAFILASINGEAQISPIAKLYVNILDLNDNPPEFTMYSDYTTNRLSKPIQLSFLEGPIGVNTKHDLPRAFDADFSPINRVKTYWIEWDNTNQLVNNNLQKSSISTFSKLSSLSTMTYSNDQIWSKLGPFRLIYKKSIGNLIIQLDQELDREEQSIYRLRLIAQDGGDLRGSIQLIIEVDDVNEFPPVFIDTNDNEKIEDSRLFATHSTQEVYKKQYRIKESLDIGSRIGKLTAIDHDLSMSNETNNQITYHFGSNQMNWDVTRIFHLDSHSGILTLKHPLDYESVKSYRLTVIAQDGLIKQETDASRSLPSVGKKVSQIIHSSTALIDIIVVDVNDNSPVILFENDYITSEQSQLLDISDYFTDKASNKKKTVKLSDITMNIINKPYEVWIKENVPKGTPIVFFNVIDRDTGLNSRISCQLLNSTEIFSIHELSDLYRIETNSLLDREHIDQYMIRIQCNDMGEPILYTSKSLIIHLIDINDSPPKFPFNIYHFHVLENSPPGTPIQSINTIITATDPDLNNTLTYRLESCVIKSIQNQSINNNLLIQSLDYQLFSIDSITGEIFTQGELDREKKSSLEFCLCADDGLHSTCSSVIVNLDDVNDNLPYFEHDTYVIHLEENKYYYKPIILFTVTDLDSNNKGFKFNILTDSKKPLDNFKNSLKQNNIVKQQSETLNSNHFQYNKTMNKIVANDDDDADDELIRKYFTIRENGLYLQNVLDREERTNYHFYVQVHDLQYNNITNIHNNKTVLNEYLTSQTEIFIHVTDINDNIPIFIFPNVTTSSGNRLIISCHEMLGSSIGQIQGYDPDQGINGTLIYNLIMLSSNIKQLFHLDNNSGELFVNTNELNEYCGKSITLIISIDDQGPEISKIGRYIQMERLIIQLDDKPSKMTTMISSNKEGIQQLKQKWQMNSNELTNLNMLNSNSVSSITSSIGTSTFSTKTILSITLGGSTIFLISLLITSAILIMYNKLKYRKSLITLKNLHLTNDTTHISHHHNQHNNTTNNEQQRINDELICIECKQDELSKISLSTNKQSDEYMIKPIENYPTSTSRSKSIHEDNNDNNQDNHHIEQGNVQVHSHLCNPNTPYTPIDLHHCGHDVNTGNITQLNDYNNTNNKHYSLYPTTHLPSFMLTTTHNLGQSSSLLSTVSLSPQQQKRQLYPSSPNSLQQRQSCIGDQINYHPNVTINNKNNSTMTTGCFVQDYERKLPSLLSLSQQQHRNHQVPTIPLKLNIQSICDNVQNQLDNDQGKLNGSQHLFENNNKYNITQNYQQVNKCGYEKPPVGRSSSKCLLNNNNNNSNNTSSKNAHKSQDLHNKSNSLRRLSKNVSFIPSMPCFDNYPLKKTLNTTDYFMHNSILKSPPKNYELFNRQHLYQFKSNPNIFNCTNNNLIDDLHLTNSQLGIMNKPNYFHKQNLHLPPPVPMIPFPSTPPPLPHRFLTPPCTRRLTQSNYHIKSIPMNIKKEDCITYSKDKPCNCIMSNINSKLVTTSSEFMNFGLVHLTNEQTAINKLNCNSINNINNNDNNLHYNVNETCCDYISNYESEICSQCQLINFRNSPTPPILDSKQYSLKASNDFITTSTINTIHSIASVINNDSVYCINNNNNNNNSSLLNFSNEEDHYPSPSPPPPPHHHHHHNEYMHQLDYSTNSLTIHDVLNSCV